jgi:hypothetical protein
MYFRSLLFIIRYSSTAYTIESRAAESTNAFMLFYLTIEWREMSENVNKRRKQSKAKQKQEENERENSRQRR